MIPEAESRGCTVLPQAGTFVEMSAVDVLKYLVMGQTPLDLTLGLATANALINSSNDKMEDADATSYLDIQPGEEVVMVGLLHCL